MIAGHFRNSGHNVHCEKGGCDCETADIVVYHGYRSSPSTVEQKYRPNNISQYSEANITSVSLR